ncbi:hypothetical protein [Longimicrobium sp.]|uniref:hypothetical protein n=1 Tax=Longimicrobium sp. TaxID=2029185 RepID=UPI002BCC32D9|nr:hypothetical protein [Longimicrobium sp.]HSU16814.1 hypothetical protein [Longimicrobium sp.]
MPFMGVMSIDDQVAITFHADPANGGSSALATGYVPDGSHLPPPTQFDMVAPGGVQTQHTRVQAALSLKITVDAPVDGGGQLQVFVNDTLRDQGQVGDTIWTYAIV